MDDDSEFLELLVLADQFEAEGNLDIAEELREQAAELFEEQEAELAEAEDEEAREVTSDFEGMYDFPEIDAMYDDVDYSWDDFVDDYGEYDEHDTTSGGDET